MDDDRFDLTGRVALITGGGSGIGRATALLFARYGAHAILADLRQANADKVAHEVRAIGGHALPVKVDVRAPQEIEVMMERTLEEFDRIDILVNCAGGGYSVPVEEMTVEFWDKTVNLNLRGPFLCSQAVGRIMTKQGGGVIINISSGNAFRASPGVAAYGSAKAGLVHLTRLLAAEWGEHGIRVNAVAPGAIKSEGYIQAMMQVGKDPDSGGGDNALRRIGYPEEIAYTNLFLASDAASFVNGQTICVDGGPPLWTTSTPRVPNQT